MVENKKNRELLRKYYQDEKGDFKLDDDLVQWLLDDRNREEVNRLIRELWEMEERELAEEDKQRLFGKILEKIEREPEPITRISSNRRVLKRALAIVAVVVPLFFIVATLYLVRDSSATYTQDSPMAIETERGETKESLLSDSSKVWLNSGSEIKYYSSKVAKERNVSLSGEAYFEVRGVEESPFIVETQFATVTVFGTSFNVEAYPNEQHTVVRLDEGKVVVELSGGDRYLLNPQELLILDNQDFSVDVIEAIGVGTMVDDWRKGAIVCYRMTVEEMLTAIERKLEYNMVVDSEVVFSEKEYVTTFSSSDTIEDIIEMIRYIEGGFSYNIRGNNIYITKE